MRFTTQLIATVALATLGAAASAAEAERDPPWSPGTASRAEVSAQARSAVHAYTMLRGDDPFLVANYTLHSTLTRAQVMAEGREAMRLGLIPFGEAQYRFATPADNERIRLAGLRAINADSQVAGK
jgi:hypothetical protein